MNFSSPIVHQIDTRQNSTLTVFDGSHDDETKLAKQFWNSLLLMPPVESTLVCKEIRQRTKNRPLNEKPKKLPSNVVKAQQQKILKNKQCEEIATFKTNEDELNRIRAVRQRHEQIRQLFFKHATKNRSQQNETYRQNTYPINNSHREENFYRDEPLETFRIEEENERKLVQFLPD